ncbi:MAG: hypothetical protein O2985_15480, partial [Proteobacteria bacterium]|nr:hypothetical protein [Pseudomonadota bacterium]
VDDLIRVVQLAHQAFVKREKNLAKDLDRELQLDPRPIVRPDTLSVIGYEIQVIRVRPGANRQRRDPLTFAALPAPYGAEIDCAAILKLASALRTLSLERDQAILLPVRFETLSHPLYLDNLMAALQMLQNDLRSRLICCLVIERASLPPRLDTVAKALQRFCKTVFIHPRQPFHGLDEAKSLGIGGLALSAADFASDADLQALEALVAKAREVDLFVMLLGASSELDTAQKLNLAYSRLKD